MGTGGANGVTAEEILSSLEKASTPLSFIQNNLKPIVPPLDAQGIANKAAEARVTNIPPPLDVPVSTVTTTAPFVPPDPASPDVTPQNPDNPLVGPVATLEMNPPLEEKDQVIVEGDNDPALSDVPNIPAPENFKRLRSKVKAASTELVQTKAQLEEAATKLKQYESGELVPDKLQEMENKAAEGEYYKKLHNLKMSKEYQESYLNPIQNLVGRLKEIATDYNVPESVMVQASKLTNRAELNRFLTSHFDELGALEVKNLVGELNEVQSKAREAEAEPARILSEMQAEAQRTAEIRDANRKQKIIGASKSNWSRALQSHVEDGLVTELIPRENDPEFNSQYVEPIVQKAATDYGKLVTALAEAGLEELPDEVALALAHMCQLAHATGTAVTTRNAAMEHASNIEKNAKRVNSLLRPRIGAGGGGEAPSAPAPKTHSTPQEAGASLIGSILSRRGGGSI